MDKWICNRCGKELEVKPKKNQTCECKGRYSKFTVCEKCGKWFKNERDYAFCSSECGRYKRKVTAKQTITCEYCGRKFDKYIKDIAKSKKHFCCKECLANYHLENRIERVCKECGTIFEVSKGKISDKTNAKAKFCSKDCYYKFLADFNRTDTYRGFKQAKKKYFKGTQFCALCGTTKKIQIHHIVPYRLTQDNSKENLIPLCVKHHKVVEYLGLDILKANVNYESMKILFGAVLRERQLATAYKIKEIQEYENHKNQIV